jgi:hypothetical protein
LPQPVHRCVQIREDSVAPALPRNAKALAQCGHAMGYAVRVTHAVGYDSNADGSQATQDVMEPTGEMTKGGKKSAPRPAMHKVGEELRPPVNSIRVIVRTPDDKRFIGHWKDNGWDFGLILDGRTLVRNCNWTQLKEALDAEGRENLRDTQLSLEGDDGKPL